jgi:hypothetical protein
MVCKKSHQTASDEAQNAGTAPVVQPQKRQGNLNLFLEKLKTNPAVSRMVGDSRAHLIIYKGKAAFDQIFAEAVRKGFATSDIQELTGDGFRFWLTKNAGDLPGKIQPSEDKSTVLDYLHK